MRGTTNEGPDEVWVRAIALFERALERPPTEHDASIAGAGRDNPEAATLAAQLLRAFESSPGALQPPRFLSMNRPDRLRATLSVPNETGVIVREELGTGGMGVVYEAVQEATGQTVALKLLRSARRDDETLERFRGEVKTMARLGHDNVARVITAGEFQDELGRPLPYLVTELVPDAADFVTDLDRRELGIRERVTLFLPLCDGVQHAHARLVIHRDLKPGNVLVGPSGVPKIIDFGLAKILDGDENPLTRDGHVMGTVGYAAPELLRNPAQADTRSDVFSLGAILHHALCGAPPRVRGDASLEATLARVLAGERVEPRTIRPDLPEPLAWIIQRAMAADPDARYDSARELRDDLGRFLRHEPVRARRPSVLHRARLWSRRHRAALGAATLVLLALLGGIVSTSVEAAESHRQAVRRRQVIDATVGIFSRALPENTLGEPLSIVDLVDQEAAQLLSTPDDASELRVELLEVLARIYLHLGRLENAEQLVERALDQRALLPEQDSESALRSLLLLGDVRSTQGDSRTARALYRKAYEAARRRPGDLCRYEAEAARHLAKLDREEGNYEGAEKRLRHALDRLVRFCSEGSVEALHLWTELASTYKTTGRYKEAIEIYRNALADMREKLGTEHPEVLEMAHNLALALGDDGQTQEAADLMRVVQDGFQRMYGPRHWLTLRVQNSLGLVQETLGRTDEAVDTLRGVAEANLVLREHHPQTVNAIANLGEMLRRQGSYEEARKWLLEAKERADVVETPPDLHVNILNNLALLDLDTGHAERALIGLEEVLSLRTELFGSVSAASLEVKKSIASALHRLNRGAEAIELLREVRSSSMEHRGAGDPITVAATRSLGEVLYGAGRHDEAEPFLAEAVRLDQESGNHSAPAALVTAACWGVSLYKLGKLDRAIAIFLLTHERCVATHGPAAPETTAKARNLAILYANLGRFRDALHWGTIALEHTPVQDPNHAERASFVQTMQRKVQQEVQEASK